MKKSGPRPLLWLWILFLAGVVVWVAVRPVPPVTRQHPVRVKVEQLPEEETPLGEELSKVASVIAPILPLPEAIKPPPAGAAPKIAVVIDDMGLNIPGSERAARLPGFVTLSYMPYASHLAQQTEAAHAAGHELILHMPMEPLGHEDPGPGALLTSLPADEMRARFDKALDSFPGFDGVNNHMGSKFTADEAGMEMVAGELQKRHLFFLDSRTSARSVGEAVAHARGIPAARRDVFIDDDLSPSAINAQLAQLERIARHKGAAIAIGHPHDATLAALEAWLHDAQKRGFKFVPLHDLMPKAEQ